ncbi:MAG: hypothetical protein ACI81R_001496, partial [Bradymonadia bacterium]
LPQQSIQRVGRSTEEEEGLRERPARFRSIAPSQYWVPADRHRALAGTLCPCMRRGELPRKNEERHSEIAVAFGTSLVVLEPALQGDTHVVFEFSVGSVNDDGCRVLGGCLNHESLTHDFPR